MGRQTYLPSCAVVFILLQILTGSTSSTEDLTEELDCVVTYTEVGIHHQQDHVTLILEMADSLDVGIEYSVAFRQSPGRISEGNASGLAYVNTKWSNQTEIKITDVIANSWYDVKLYARAQGNELMPQSAYFSSYEDQIATIKDSITISISIQLIPSAPWNLVATQISRTKVWLEWMEPYRAGYDTIYNVSLSPSHPEYSVLTEGRREHIVDYDFIDGTNYTFTVTVDNPLDSCGVKAAETHLMFDADAVSQVTNLTVSKRGKTWVHLSWNAVSNVTGYTVRTNSTNRFIPCYPLLNTKETNCKITGLSPHTEYYFHVSAYRGDSSGPADLYFSVVTRGESLPTVEITDTRSLPDQPTAVEVVWEKLVQPEAKWKYALYYGTSKQELFERGVRHVTKDTALTVRDLDACEMYFFSVIVVELPFAFGSGSYDGEDVFTTVATGRDLNAPPKKVAVRYSAGSATDAEIVWSPPCHPQNTSLDYLVTVRDLTLNSTLNFSLSSNDSRLHLRQSFHYGADYEIFIQVDSPESRAFGPLAVAGPPIPPPHQLALERHNNGDMVLHWKDQDLPAQVVSQKYSYYVWLSADQLFEDSDVIQLQTTDRMLLLSREWQQEIWIILRNGTTNPMTGVADTKQPEEIFYAAVSIFEEHGYKSARSEPIHVTILAGDKSKSPAVYTALAIAGAIILILAVIVLVIRYRRYQRSSTGNSDDKRYHIRSDSVRC